MLKDLELDKKSDVHLYLQLYRQLKEMIEEGDLKAHTKLPPIRKSANELGVNNATIVKAYDLLAEEELVYKKVGSGTFVEAKINFEQIDDFSLDNQIYIDEEAKFSREEKTINFATAAPDPKLFPIMPFKRLLNKVLDRDKGYAFGYQKSQGYLPLRRSIADYNQQQGIKTAAEHIQIVSGAQQGIDILAKALLDYGATVFTESPSYPGAISVFKSRKANIVEIPIAEDGLNIEVLREKLAKNKPEILYLMSSFQNPTGYSYAKEKKEEILALAQEYDFLIVEDDCLGDLNYESEQNLSFKALDDKERVIYIKSFSKLLMPGLRLAFLVIPEPYLNKILLSKYISDIFTDGLIQRVLDLYLKEEVWQKQLKELKDIYKKRYFTILSAFKTYLPSAIEYNKPGGGFNFWLKLPAGLSEERVYDRALGAGIKLAPGSYFYSNESNKNRLRLSIAAVNEVQIETGVQKLSSLVRELISEAKNNHSEQMLL